MTEPAYLRAIRASYDTIAVDYAERYRTFLATSPLDRAMLGAFADLVQAAGGGLVADLGCGPGHLTAHLDGLGVAVLGVDLSPKMVEIARQAYRGLRFREGSMTALDLPDGELGGILAWYSTHHLPPAELPAVFAEFHRTLAPGGYLMLGIHVGDEHLHAHQAYGHPVSYDSYLLPPDRVAGLLAQAGLVVTARLLREPDEKRKRPQACLLARKPGPATSLSAGEPGGAPRARLPPMSPPAVPMSSPAVLPPPAPVIAASARRERMCIPGPEVRNGAGHAEDQSRRDRHVHRADSGGHSRLGRDRLGRRQAVGIPDIRA